jgi:hypothetical protein
MFRRMTNHPGRPILPVPQDELARAVTVWLRTSPPSIWKAFTDAMVLQVLRRADSRFDPVAPLAEHIAAKLVQAGWTVTRVEPGMVRSPGASQR